MNNDMTSYNAEEAVVSRYIYQKIAKFNQERNWDQFHTPKDLSISISLEAAELLECFQWSGSDMHVDKKKEKIIEETADILIYALQMCQVLQIVPEDIINNKLAQNELKYPVDIAFGSALKYTELQKQPEKKNPTGGANK